MRKNYEIFHSYSNEMIFLESKYPKGFENENK